MLCHCLLRSSQLKWWNKGMELLGSFLSASTTLSWSSSRKLYPDWDAVLLRSSVLVFGLHSILRFWFARGFLVVFFFLCNFVVLNLLLPRTKVVVNVWGCPQYLTSPFGVLLLKITFSKTAWNWAILIHEKPVWCASWCCITLGLESVHLFKHICEGQCSLFSRCLSLVMLKLLKPHCMASCKRHQGEAVRKRKDIYETGGRQWCTSGCSQNKFWDCY